jgi:prophage tail gpP-like protein
MTRVPDKDKVSLLIGNREVSIGQEYAVRASIFAQPSSFSIRVGGNTSVRELRSRFPLGAPFVLSVAGRPQRAGTIDTHDGAIASNGGSYLAIEGRDVVGKLLDAEIENEFSLIKPTVRTVIEKALKDCGITGAVLSDAAAVRKKAVGSTVTYRVTEDKAGRWVVIEDASGASGGDTNNAVRGRLGMSYYQWLRQYTDRAGVYVWSDGDGSLIVASPDGEQDPTYRLQRRLGYINDSRIIATKFHNSVVGRHARCRVFARAGGGKYTRSTFMGEIIDPEMMSLGFIRGTAIRDKKVRNGQQARLYAARALANERRKGFSLRYTVQGHTTTAVDGSEAVWAPDTVVAVDDAEGEFRGHFYVETVEWARTTAGTTTTLDLIRTTDLPDPGE